MQYQLPDCREGALVPGATVHGKDAHAVPGPICGASRAHAVPGTMHSPGSWAVQIT